MLVNPNVDIVLDVDRNVGSLDVLDDVANVEVLPNVMTVVNEVCKVDILLNDFVHNDSTLKLLSMLSMVMMVVMRFS